ncbi:hypothetical protein V1517DRAFT_311535 [Lipomyces orientalis]|uniref:Uncharacterized protein n=1 Tax=Lipomyces orientalis TaxID=1233043 RepID=A0ACC3TYW1_9ASCO
MLSVFTDRAPSDNDELPNTNDDTENIASAYHSSFGGSSSDSWMLDTARHNTCAIILHLVIQKINGSPQTPPLSPTSTCTHNIPHRNTSQHLSTRRRWRWRPPSRSAIAGNRRARVVSPWDSIVLSGPRWVRYLTALFDDISTTDMLTRTQRQAHICLQHKRGSTADLTNWRPVTLQNADAWCSDIAGDMADRSVATLSTNVNH